MTTTQTVKTLERAFRLGSVTLPDPDPSLPPEDAMRLFEANFPIIASSTIGEPFLEGDRLIVPILKPDVKTKGGGNGQASTP